MLSLLAVVLLAGACRGGTGTDGPLGGGEVTTLARGDIRNVAVDATYDAPGTVGRVERR